MFRCTIVENNIIHMGVGRNKIEASLSLGLSYHENKNINPLFSDETNGFLGWAKGKNCKIISSDPKDQEWEDILREMFDMGIIFEELENE